MTEVSDLRWGVLDRALHHVDYQEDFRYGCLAHLAPVAGTWRGLDIEPRYPGSVLCGSHELAVLTFDPDVVDPLISHDSRRCFHCLARVGAYFLTRGGGTVA